MALRTRGDAWHGSARGPRARIGRGKLWRLAGFRLFRCAFCVRIPRGIPWGILRGSPMEGPLGDPHTKKTADRSGTARNQPNATTCDDQPRRADRERTRATPRLNWYATSTLRECSRPHKTLADLT